jgi:hypothetical protein
MRIPDPEAIAHAEAQLADVQSTLDEVRHMLRAAEQVERTAQKGIKAIPRVARAAVGLVLIVAIAAALRRRNTQ